VTTDERIDAISMHLEITARMVEDNEKRANEENGESRATSSEFQESSKRRHTHPRTTSVASNGSKASSPAAPHTGAGATPPSGISRATESKNHRGRGRLAG
jgi:hypothetical protein